MRVLVTGLSGVGKSALLAELASRGFVTVDTDYGPYHHVVAGERLWREDVVAELLASTPSLFVSGAVRNQMRFGFSHVVLLSCPASVLAHRLATRTSNSYGKGPGELEEALEYLETVEPLLRASATLEVVTTIPVARVADVVLEHVL
ncbi:ATP-binding protein [Amycolatopsis rhabdoformis]|uniref:ATP-binding protein n=1 Tax=Amycolatopsis rhabdoformis TaxID=1448059 RepID=A0ABZ1I2S9_9PSEU|nr:ATP-binding protein [Amycolatopsis rhabdoformis]WSE28681.1 ATP-binding protein [Amycolatopsis rhabdoformis]